ncbi:hypothetical protein B1C78_07500 [Thioalkalivibrio denitrificans]|uniref:Pilus assembly protein PilW n=1 Tax=Thioalkalivibrio denitrificans TaxID=108003 RepID=A0A1V3NIL0_9GAMM|nr:PilW family protein [Thioalkalivibrio denitrificans]OOG24911.1 hypothetical protein B1C78_07500 [Thioalkalivibrio denitrificans]
MRARPIQAFCRRQQGLSLVELMVALLIALILTAGVIQIFLGSNQTYRFTEGASRVQENARFAMDTLQRDLRMAGYRGCTRNITSWLNDTSGTEWEHILGGPAVTGWEAGGTAPGNLFALPGTASWSNGTASALPTAINNDGNRIPGSDILVVNGARVLDIQPSASQPQGSVISLTGPNGLPGHSIVLAVAGDCSGGDLWQKQSSDSAANLSRGSGGSPGNWPPAGTPFANIHGGETQILSFRSTAYYVRTGASGEPSLYRLRLDPRNDEDWQAEELVEGVESMQVLYGLDDTGNRTADEYVTAAGVSDWESVVSVRVALLMRSPQEVNNEPDTRVYNLIGTRIDPVDDRRIRQVATTTVAVRNRLP